MNVRAIKVRFVKPYFFPKKVFLGYQDPKGISILLKYGGSTLRIKGKDKRELAINLKKNLYTFYKSISKKEELKLFEEDFDIGFQHLLLHLMLQIAWLARIILLPCRVIQSFNE